MVGTEGRVTVMGDITYCANKDCPFSDCNRHLDNAPRNGMVTMAWLDRTCRDYIGWLVYKIERGDKNG